MRDFQIAGESQFLPFSFRSLDKPIFVVGHIVSGHILEHLAAAAAGHWIVRMLPLRYPHFVLGHANYHFIDARLLGQSLAPR